MTKFEPMVNVGGKISPLAQATIPVVDRGFLYGDSVYEVFRTVDGVALFLEDHLDRLDNSAGLVQMEISDSRAQLVSQVSATIQSSGALPTIPLFVRLQVSRGVGPIDLYPPPRIESRTVIIVKQLPDLNQRFYSEGIRLCVSSVRRNPTNALDPNIKGGNYLNNILAVTQARNDTGADDALLATSEGLIAEASNSNVWFVVDGKLLTPAHGNLRGITKKHIHIALQSAGQRSDEADLTIDAIRAATECFVTSTTRGIMPCLELRLEDGAIVHFPKGGGEMTRLTKKVFLRYVRRHVENNPHNRLVVE